jgi:hypothetical protein
MGGILPVLPAPIRIKAGPVEMGPDTIPVVLEMYPAH